MHVMVIIVELRQGWCGEGRGEAAGKRHCDWLLPQAT